MFIYYMFNNLSVNTDQKGSIAYELIGGNEVVYGPYTFTSLQQYLDEGRIDGETQIRVSGTEDWMPFGGILTPTAATPTEYEPLAAGGAADINVMDGLERGVGHLAKKYGGFYWSVFVSGLLEALSGCLIIGPLFLAGPMAGGMCIFS